MSKTSTWFEDHIIVSGMGKEGNKKFKAALEKKLEEKLKRSECCNAEIVYSDMCSKCKEHI